MNTNLKSHRELADFIAGKKILHLNSFGKDSILALEWLTDYAHPSEVVSMHMEPFVPHPKDAMYLKYLKKKFPHVKFVKYPNSIAMSGIMYEGIFQSPITAIEYNKCDYNIFKSKDLIESAIDEQGCDYACDGRSKYESFSRAVFFKKNGLNKDRMIYPLGNMSKKQVMSLIGKTKLHPVYRLCESSLDFISYYKMRSTFIAYPEFYEDIKKFYPLIELDKYRYEVLFNER